MTEVKITEHYFTCDREECEARYEASKGREEADRWTVLIKLNGKDLIHFCPDHNPYHAQKYQGDMITLGALKDWLEKIPKDALIIFNDGNSPGIFDSYRGYYDQIAVNRSTAVPDADIFYEQVVNAIGSTHTGWKGGEYKMTKETPIWVSKTGEASGVGIVGMEHNGTDAVLIVRKVE